MEGYMSVVEAAEALGVNRQRVHALIKAGVLEAERVGNVFAVSIESVERRKANNPGPGKPKAAK